MDVFIIAKHKLALNYFLQTLIIVVIDFKRKHTYIDDTNVKAGFYLLLTESVEFTITKYMWNSIKRRTIT